MKLQTVLKGAAAPIALATALTASPIFLAGANAQETSTSQGGVILVTGSRIARNPEVEGPNPVVSLGSETIEQSGETNLTELLTEVPALFGSEDNFAAAGSQARTGAAGVNLLNLRNLGANRTLVLVNGRRHVAGVSGEAAVDITTLPVALLDRVDILTGGVSSVYGADGVSGVVNFITKRDFEGLDLRGQLGISDFNDAGSAFMSATAGKNFAGGRGNIAASYEYRFDDRVGFGDRPAGQFDSLRFVRNPDDLPDDDNVPDLILLPYIGYADSAPGGAVAVDDFFVSAFRGDGLPYNGGTFLPSSGFLSTGGPDTDDTPVGDYQGDLQAKTEHHSINLLTSYQLTDTISFFAEGKYVNSNNFTISQPSFDFYTWIPADNAFVPQPIRDALVPGGFAFYGIDDGYAISRDNFDLGVRNERFQRDLWRGVVGFDGDLTDHVQFELSYVHGRNDTTYISENYRIWDRYFAALDAVDEGEFNGGPANGNIVCRVDLNGGTILPFNILDVTLGSDVAPSAPQTFEAGDGSCQPLNLFGEGSPSQEALDFINVDLNNNYVLTQDVINGYITGDFGKYFELPGGPVGFVLGAEYRKETSDSVVDPISTIPRVGQEEKGVLADFARVDDEFGKFDVIEGFAELRLPIIADQPGFELLELSAQVRLSEYSTVGTTESWAVSGIWSPIEDIAFRGTYSKAVRAPNITELFAPRTGTFSRFTDPCDPDNVTKGDAPDNRAANCRAIIEGLGVNYDNYDYSLSPQSSATEFGRFGGNADLNPEDARTWTAGVVLQPRFVPGLDISLDWYDIRIEDAINTASLTETAEFCVDSDTIENIFCDKLVRSEVTGYIDDYFLRPENTAFFETAGADFTIRYQTALAPDFGLAVRGTVGYLDKLSFLPANEGRVDDDLNEVGSPQWVGNADVTLNYRNFSLNYGVQYIGETLRSSNAIAETDPDRYAPEYYYIDDRFVHDIRGEVKLADGQFSVYAGANNFTNEQPTIGSIVTPVGWRGRYYFAGMRMTLADIFN